MEKINSKKKSILTVIIVFVVLAVVFVGVYFLSNLREPKDVVNYLEEVSYSEYSDLCFGDANKDNLVLVLLARPDCSWCQKFKPILRKAANEYHVKVNYVNVGGVTEEEYMAIYSASKSLSASGSEGIPTPTTLLYKNGEEIDNISGYVDYDKVIEFFRSNGLIDNE